MLEYPGSCFCAWLYSLFIAGVTLLSVALYIADSIPETHRRVASCAAPVCDNDANLCPNNIICEPESPILFQNVEKICVYLFVMDYFLRFFFMPTVSPRLAGLSKFGVMSSNSWMTTSTPEIPHDENLINNPYGQGIELISIRDEDESDVIKHNGKSTTSSTSWTWENVNYWKLFLITLRKWWYYETQAMNIVDFVSVLPFFLEFADSSGSGTLATIRLLRLVRILRILKLGKGSKGVQVLFATMVASLPALLILGFFALIGVTLLGALAFFFEGGSYVISEEYPDGAYVTRDLEGEMSRSLFTSIPMSMYFAIISSTSVGFGDLTPFTYAGRLIACVAMYGGTLVLALPISVIGNNFNRIYDMTQGHLSYGAVNAMLELMEEDSDLDTLQKGKLYDMYAYRRLLIERRASKLACIFVIAHVCLTGLEIENMDDTLVKAGLYDMVCALEYLYDLDFRCAQLFEFAKLCTSKKSPNVDSNLDDQMKTAKKRAAMLIGHYQFGENTQDVDWQLIGRHEIQHYTEEFKALTPRTQDLVHYLRKAPTDISVNFLSEYVKRLNDTNATPLASEVNSSDHMTRKDVDTVHALDLQKSHIIQADRRVQIAYKRLQMAMHNLEAQTTLRVSTRSNSPPSIPEPIIPQVTILVPSEEEKLENFAEAKGNVGTSESVEGDHLPSALQNDVLHNKISPTSLQEAFSEDPKNQTFTKDSLEHIVPNMPPATPDKSTALSQDLQ